MLRAKPKDGTNANSNKMMNLMPKSASIKQSDNMIALSSDKRLLMCLETEKHLSILYLYQNMKTVT